MKTIVLISCSKRKVGYKAKAEDLYVSPLFKKSLAYARSLRPDGIFILSAKHGLLPLDKEISPYDVTLNGMPEAEIKKWSLGVISQLKDISDFDGTEYVLVAGRNYVKYLTPYFKKYTMPFEGLGLGRRLSKLKELLL